MANTDFEYKKKKHETPFETFLRYTDEKEKSAVKLAKILQEVLRHNSHILDIGTGNGEYLGLALSKFKLPSETRLTLIEPSKDLMAQLEERFKKVISPINLKVINADLQQFDDNEHFDAILMSHLFYHLPRASWTEQLAQALHLLTPDGVLIIVLREKDDAYDFKMAFKPLLFDEFFKALTIDDVLSSLPKEMKLEVTKYDSASELRIPFEENQEDAISIIEFYLNKQWEEMPKAIQRGAMEFVAARKGVLKQLDGIAVLKKS